MNLLQTPAPDFRHALGLLGACHRRIEGFNALLLRLPEHLERHGVDAEAVEAAQRVLKYFDSAAQHHHEDEEHDLFPQVRAAAEREGNTEIPALIDRLLLQHQDMGAAWQALRVPLLEMAQCRAVEAAALPVARFVELYRQHIPLEDDQLLPYALKVLTPQQVEALGDAMAERRSVGKGAG